MKLTRLLFPMYYTIKEMDFKLVFWTVMDFFFESDIDRIIKSTKEHLWNSSEQNT